MYEARYVGWNNSTDRAQSGGHGAAGYFEPRHEQTENMNSHRISYNYSFVAGRSDSRIDRSCGLTFSRENLIPSSPWSKFNKSHG